MGMSARSTAPLLATLGICAWLACKENIPRPPDQPDDGGAGTPADVSSIDGPAAPPDLAADTTPAPTCGTPGQACCPGNVCAAGGCCVSGQCVANGTSCRADATCLEGSCGGCGSNDPKPQDCCVARSCTASYSVCLGGGAGMCQHCGAAGESCCGDGYCAEKLRCDTSVAPPGMCVPK